MKTPSRTLLRIAALAAAVLPLATPTGSAIQTPAEGSAPSDAEHRAAFDYLLGDWEFDGERRTQAGWMKFKGYWPATRTPDSHSIVDEYRVVGDDGQTIYVTTTLRAFHPAEHRWSIVSIESSGAFAEGKAWKEGSDMQIEQSFGGRLLRFRYHDIRPERFSWLGTAPDGSGGQVEFQRIEARRVGPPRAGVLAVRPASGRGADGR
jgi:hypothetical protein